MKENAMVEAKLFFLLPMINEFSIWVAELWARTSLGLFPPCQVYVLGILLFDCPIVCLLDGLFFSLFCFVFLLSTDQPKLVSSQSSLGSRHPSVCLSDCLSFELFVSLFFCFLWARPRLVSPYQVYVLGILLFD